MFGLFRHVGKNQRSKQKRVCVITASRACDLHSGTIKPPNYSPSPDCNPSKRSSRSYLSAASRPHTQCAFPSQEGHWQLGGSLPAQSPRLPLPRGGVGNHKVWSLLSSCSRHRWPKTKARLCETSLLRALAAGSPTELLALPPREEEAGFSCANGRATLFWDFTPHGIYEDLLHIQQSLLPSRTPTVWPSSGAEEGGTIKQEKKHRVEGEKENKDRETEREREERCRDPGSRGMSCVWARGNTGGTNDNVASATSHPRRFALRLGRLPVGKGNWNLGPDLSSP